MANSHLLLLLLISSLFSVHHSGAATESESESLLKIQQLLNYPPPLNLVSSKDGHSLCSIEPTPSLTLSCYQGNVTQLHISGGGAAFPPLPRDFSTHSLFSALASAFPTLKVLSLVSLRLWGPLPPSIAGLSSLEILNLTSNYLSGAIPPHISSLVNLQTLILDRNNFTGRLPPSLASLRSLAVLSLNHNLLNGFLPRSLASLQTLRVLSLSHNFLAGEVPDLKSLTNLQFLDLEANYFGPRFPSLRSKNKLVTLVLRNNKFRLGIQTGFRGGFQLQRLDISLNQFVGPFSPSWLSLPSINYLDIAGNKFTGVLSKNMSCNAELAFVNLSSNLLAGDLPTCLKNRGSKSSSVVVLYSGNCLTNVDQKQQQHPSTLCHHEALAVEIPPPGDERRKRLHDIKQVVASKALAGIVGAAAIVALAFMAVKWLYGEQLPVKSPRTRLIRDSASTVNTAKLLSDAKYISETMKLGASVPAYRTFSLEELKEATNDFDDSTLLGEGKHGQMYRGKLTNGTLVAIRGLKMRKRQAPQVYTHHLELISKLRHSHLVSALGHCLEYHPDDSGVGRIFLVFEFVPNGTLRGCISEGPPGRKLTWAQRIVAAIGVAKGIQFLHTGIVPGVKSNNLKITNVLLDHDLHVKISSYNLPLLAENNRGTVGTTVSSPAPKGSIQTRVNHECKNDVYDIGVILLEIILGRPIMFQNEVGVLKDLLQVSLNTDDTARRSIVDPAVHKECSDESLKTMMEICVRCLSDEVADRPSVEDILWNLQFAAQVQDSAKDELFE
ncbi:probable inactive leucine-rich repeat receptor-like protein kinase At3g03770 [Pyrus x bretschneideri]|uniref:probable inactive leucine-rich repeat receptor-like protein kinase At3g03770 n=1 Tax=Pyrus x bretschneideri TaxID=225117 RepID=UPI00202F971B|nr:probable inactive leucine-rich repeat receptor-like protein kinase At3g03770 [Pyrus x bretschneideri]